MEKLQDIVFYSLEKAIKSYRQFAQRNIAKAGLKITIDQWLILRTIQEEPSITQQQLAEKVFKDMASITRMIELLVKNGYLVRDFHKEDRRRFQLTLSKNGVNVIKRLEPIIQNNRAKALEKITQTEIVTLERTLAKISSNCHEEY